MNKSQIKSLRYPFGLRYFFNGKDRTSTAIVFHTAAVLASLLGCQNYTRAQISSDGTVSTEVNNSGNDSTIEGGTAQGSNLFHSFQEFSVPTGNTAYFNNAAEIENIIGRVTGNSSSTIDGLLRANGNANLILLNPNGIDFGDNARLDIGGSFLGSTAESLIFEDGTIFDARDPSVSPLLTVSTPVGLQLGQNSGAIDVGGVGHDLGVEVPVFSPFSRGEVSGLELESGNTLGLVGNGLSFTGGVVVSETGRVELGSVAEGIVDINWNEQSFFLSYQEITAFRDIELNERSLIDTSGNNSGSVNIQGSQVTIADASVVLVQNQGAENSGNLTVNATSSFSLSDISEDRVVASGIYTEALGSGKGGNINVTTPNLSITDGASIFADSFGSAASGDININVSDSIEIIGFAANDPRKFSIITAQVFSTGDAGTITINTNSLTALNGGNVASVTGNQNATGSGGDVIINAGESILLSGVTPITAPSQITAGSGSAGNAGNVQLNTKVLTLENGGRVDASATASGNAGNVNINATESIMVTGTVPDSLNPSLIIASANILDLELRELFNLPPIPSGNSGSVTISTPQLQIMDGGQVTVRNDGTGNAGNLKITADSINLASNGGITAAVESGEGGTINLEVANAINLTGGSQIASDNNGVGDGGEIAIAASSLSISDSSFITTTTFGAGQGGDIMLSLTDSLNITGTGFREFQDTFQANSLNGSLEAGTRGTGIFNGTAAEGIGGNLEIDANAINLAEGGIIFSPIFTDGRGGDINVTAQDINISGSALQIGAGVDSTNAASGGNIFINADRLRISDGGTIVNATFGSATGGDITIDVAESVNLQNTPDNSRLFTGIYANTSIGNGTGGNVELQAQTLSIDDAFISSSTGGFINDGADLAFSGGGDGGNINISVADSIDISGIFSDPRFASGISSSSFTNGAAGEINIFTNRLSIRDGSEIAATTIDSGDGGSINIDANNSVELFGTTTVNNMQRGGLIATSGRAAFSESPAGGKSGNITVNAGSLTVQEGASIDVQSLGTGQAGDLEIQVEQDLLLDSEGSISAATSSNIGGDINIAADNIFSLGNSTITATANGDADGGNINIQGRNLVLLEASRLIANANMGMGGNIDIDARGLFVCQECIISASSRLGVDGVVQIDTLEPEADFGIVEVPIKLTQPEETVAQACSNSPSANNSQLIVTGRGGLSDAPSETLSGKSIISFGIPQQNNRAIKQNRQQQAKLPSPARSWYQNDKGEIILSALPAAATPQFNSPDCHVH